MKASKVQKREPKLNKEKKGPSLSVESKLIKKVKKTKKDIKSNVIRIAKKKEIRNAFTAAAIVVMAVPLFAFSSNNKKAFENVDLKVKKDVEVQSGEVFDLDLLFNIEVNDVYFDVTFENVDETLEDRDITFIKKYYDKDDKEVSESEATYANKVKYGYRVERILDSAGTYYVTIKNINNGIIYKTTMHIVDPDEKKDGISEDEKEVTNSFVSISNFIKSCTDNTEGRCQYRLLNSQGDEIETIVPETMENPNVYNETNNTQGQDPIAYNNATLPAGGGGIYRSAAGFSSSNPIARDALNWVGTSGMNCEQLFQNVIRGNAELNAKTGGDLNSVRTQVSLDDIQPGDELRYADGGVGLIHVAIYIGDGKAVHGGFHGSDTVIWDAFPAQASTPTVYRYNLD